MGMHLSGNANGTRLCLCFLPSLALSLGGGWSLVVQGISLVKAAEVAWRTGQAKTAQILAGKRMIAWGIRSIIAGGIVLGIAWFGQGMSEDDYIEWKDIIDEMLSYVDSLVLFEPQYK